MNRPPIWLLVLVLLFPAGYSLSNVRSYEPAYRADFMVSMEQPYYRVEDGIQFFGLQRIGVSQIDQATLSIDANLELAGALRMAALGKRRVRITVEVVEPRTLQEIKR